MIPKIIIQTYKSTDLPDRAKVLVNRLKTNNPDFKYIFFSDADINAFLETNYPEYIETFNNFTYTVQKIDFFRLLVIYHFGGFYFDIDISNYKCLDELCNISSCVFPQEYSQNGDPYLQNKNMNILIGNYGFGACPKNNFIKFCIDRIITPTISINDIPGKGCWYDKNIFYTTGPVLVTDCYADYINKHEILIIKPTTNDISCFGDFAFHERHGTWRIPGDPSVEIIRD